MELKSPIKEKILKRKDVLEEIKKASSESYETIWDEEGRIAIQKKKSEIKKGKKNRSKGSQFESKVRKDLEDKGFIVDKWSNNFDLEKDKVIPAKRKFNPFSKVMTIGTGFPDFIAFQKYGEHYKIIGVEVKVSGVLSREEKEKCGRLLEKGIFSQILIAKKIKENNKVRISFIDSKIFTEKMKK